METIKIVWLHARSRTRMSTGKRVQGVNVAGDLFKRVFITKTCRWGYSSKSITPFKPINYQIRPLVKGNEVPVCFVWLKWLKHIFWKKKKNYEECTWSSEQKKENKVQSNWLGFLFRNVSAVIWASRHNERKAKKTAKYWHWNCVRRNKQQSL